jgi:hypothetical protein
MLEMKIIMAMACRQYDIVRSIVIGIRRWEERSREIFWAGSVGCLVSKRNVLMGMDNVC